MKARLGATTHTLKVGKEKLSFLFDVLLEAKLGGTEIIAANNNSAIAYV
jgi:hypothetical protein